MQNIISILKFLATSNTINFVIMVWLLAVIVKKLNIVSALENSINKVKESITKSEEQKENSLKMYDENKLLMENLPNDIENLKQISNDKIKVFKDKIKNTNSSLIANMQKNVDRVVSIEEKKIVNLITEDTFVESVNIAKENIIDMLKQDPELHNKFIQMSLEELDRVNI